ncbi:MAG: M48 family metallopeptidase [Gammaproteobacteria bacterium]|nr:M48 family metallopeptidase [Gammaproteobacteria bacterium]
MISYRPLRINLTAVTALCAALIIVPTVGQTDGFQSSDLPSIGNPADQYLSPIQEAKLGAEFYRSVYRAGAVLEDPEVSNYIQHLGNVLVNSLGSGAHDYTFFVVNDSAINAFAVPGGYVGVNAGLILASDTESQLASVMAHEIAHVSQRHIARQIANMNSTQIPTLGAIFAGMLLAAGGSGEAGMALMSTGMALQQQQYLNFSREHEIEADRIGLGLLYRAGFDPTGMPQFFRTLQRNRFSSNLKQFAFLMTHPLDHVRIAEAQGAIDRLPKQQHSNSNNYLFAKARLQAVTANQPVDLARKIEKTLQKESSKKPAVIDLYAFSQALELASEFRRANATLNKIDEFDEENIPLQLGRIRSLLNSKQTESAIRILHQLMKIYPDNFAVNYYYAKAMLDSGKYAEGCKELKQFLLKNPTPIMGVHKLMAELYNANGQGIESKRTMSEYYYNTGNFNGAVFQLREALKEPNLDYITRSQIELRLRELTQMTRT